MTRKAKGFESALLGSLGVGGWAYFPMEGGWLGVHGVLLGSSFKLKKKTCGQQIEEYVWLPASASEPRS